jgi:hypothetical protein
MKRSITLIILSLTITSLAFAQEKSQDSKPAAAEEMPTVDQILDKYVKALGGKAAIEKLTSRTARGTFEIAAMNATGSFEAYAKAPNKSVSIIEVSGFGTIKEGYDGSVAWAMDPMSGLREKKGLELAAAKLDAEFHQDIKLKELYPKMEVKGKEKLGEREVYLIIATPVEGNPEKMYFDAETGLLVRKDMERESPQGQIPVEVYLEDYREVDGVKIPHTLRQNIPMFSLTIKIEEIKHNVSIEDARFAKPATQ